MKKTRNQEPFERLTKRVYVPPILEVEEIEMEQGFAASSAVVEPTAVSGNTSDVSTDFVGEDNTVFDSSF
ncbi:hypothetical protein CMU89_00930 [Elizabethkingia anophelis]|uniref:hypothetical protein n=1 Tax=Elizabethkingia anophelis TaxID=1117645 RepID=UPI000C6E4CC6|nr:hypothetical protein [Elizabethkingia anophelis]MDV3508398.1 hypothetical protein [Elizabethkingia anophelis]MDV3541234.1 hypothetical protein [Elizabethkingia anophelis]PKR31600.1 hypothetical protein CWH99_12635 [Elizabethkingia anophelis]PKR33792.1 hypothetical protein CWI00_16755 [Elizabethkingia anophelis]PRQ78284.1 hypothetical protein CMT60_18680 [Elizabethkingia anophelis]